MRAFLALDIPDDLLMPLTRLQAGLTVGRVVPEENLHLTLAFLGEISEVQAQDLAEALSLFHHPAIDLTLFGLDLFGGKRPDVLFIGGHGDGLAHLHEKIAHLVREVGIALPRSRFRPHVTLARFAKDMGPRDQARLGEFLQLNGTASYPPAHADTVTLYRSHLREDGPIYEALAEGALSG